MDSYLKDSYSGDLVVDSRGMPERHINKNTYPYPCVPTKKLQREKSQSHKLALTKLCMRWRMTHMEVCLCGCFFMLCGYLLLYRPR